MFQIDILYIYIHIYIYMYILLNSFDSTNDEINLTLTSISDNLSIVDWFNHNHKKRNSLDTPVAFIEFLKYVENSRVVVY